VITQVRVHPDGRTLSVQARHRPYETIERVEVEQTDDAVTITALVGSPEDDDRNQYVSLAVAFTWWTPSSTVPSATARSSATTPTGAPHDLSLLRPHMTRFGRKRQSSRSSRSSRTPTRIARTGRFGVRT
jgi:hypothetical protein